MSNYDMKSENKLALKINDQNLELLKNPDEGAANLVQKIQNFWNNNACFIIKKGCFDPNELERI